MARVPVRNIPDLKGRVKGPRAAKPRPPARKPAAPAAPKAPASDSLIDEFLFTTRQMYEDIEDGMPINPNQMALHRAAYRNLPDEAKAAVLNNPVFGPKVPATLGANSVDDIADVITGPDQGISKGTANRVKTVERGEQMPATPEDVDALNLRLNKMVSEGAIPDKPTAKKLFKKLGQQGFDVQENMKKLGDKTTPWSPQDITPVGLADAANPASGNWLDTVDEISNQEPKQVGFKAREQRTAAMKEEGLEDFRGGLQSRPRLERRVEVGAESKGQIPDSPYIQRQKTVQRGTGIMQKPAADTRIIDEATAADAGLAYNAAGGGDKGLSGGRGPTTPKTVGAMQDLLVEQPQGMRTARGMPTGHSLFADPKTALWKNTDEMAREIVRNSGAYSPGSASEAMAIESIQRAAETHFGPHPELDPSPNFVPDPNALKLPGAADLLDDAEFIAEVVPTEATPAAAVPALSGNPAAATPAPAAPAAKPTPAKPTKPKAGQPKSPQAQAKKVGKLPVPPPPTTPGGTPKVKTNKVQTAPGVPNPTQKKLTPKQLKAMQKKNAAKKAAIPAKKAPPPKPAPGKAASGVPPQTGTTPSTTAAQPAATTQQAPPPKAAPKAKPTKGTKGTKKATPKTTTKQAPPPPPPPKGKGKGKGKGKKQTGYVDDDPFGTKAFDAMEEANRKSDATESFRNKRNKIVAGTALAGIAGVGVREALKPGPAPPMNEQDLPGSEAGRVQSSSPSDGRPEFDESKANKDAMDAAEVLQRLRRERQENAVGSGNRPMYQVPGNMIGRLKGRI